MKPTIQDFQSPEMLSSLLDHLSAGLVYFDQNAKVLQISARALNLLGLSELQVRGLEKLPTNWKLFTEDGTEARWDQHPALLAIATGERQKEKIFRVQDSGGEISWIQVAAFPLIFKASLQPMGAVISFSDVTELNQSRKRILQDEVNLKLLSENLPGMVHELDISPDGKIRSVYASPGSKLLYEITPDEIVKGDLILLNFLEPDFKKSFFEMLKRGVDFPNQPHLSWTGQFKLASGTLKWIQVRFNVTRLADGSTRFHSFHLDVTERIRLENELQISQGRFERAIHGSNSGIWECDVANRKIWFSDVCKSMLGYQALQLKEDLETYEKLFHPEDLESAANLLEEMISLRRDHFRCDARVRAASGEYRWIQIRGNCVYNQLGQPLKITGWNIDIHEQKTVSQRLELLTNAIEEVFWMLDPRESRLIYVSPAYEKIWRKPVAQLKADPESFLHAVHPEDMVKVKKFLQRQRLEECSERYRILWPDGSVRWVQDRAFPIRKKTGEIEMVVGAASDITKEMETARLLEIQRVQAVNSAKMSALGIMAAGVAHEINNPLAIITGRAQQIISAAEAGGDKREELIRFAEGIDRTAHRIAKIIRGLRTFSRDSEKDPLEKASVQLVVEDALALCHSRFLNHGIEIQCPAISPQLFLTCRPAQISQILINLLINSYDAVESLDEKWVRLEVHAKPGVVEFRVSDSGRGIQKEIQAEMMQPFFTTKEVGKGTGLGLSIVSGLAGAHSGRVWFDDSLENTCFVVQIPSQAAGFPQT